GVRRELPSLTARRSSDLNAPSPAEIIKSLLGYEIRDINHGKTQGVEYFGSGFQRHFIYSLIRMGAKYLPRKAEKKTKDFTPSMKDRKSTRLNSSHVKMSY